MTVQQEIYLSRINKVIDHVNSNLHRKILTEELANVAHFSSFHFHRVFQAIMKESVNGYVNRNKLEKATQMLRYTNNSILNIAIDCGYSSMAIFSRAFKKYFTCSPTDYRKNGLPKDSRICKSLSPVSTYISPVKLEQTVTVKELELKNIASITVFNSFEEGKVLKELGYLIEWAKKMGVYNSGIILGMSLDDVMVTPKEKYRYVVGITVPDNFRIDHSVVKSIRLPKSKYAISRANGDIELVINTWNNLYANWLIHSAYEPNNMHAIEFFLDKDKATDWTSYNLELALPIKALQHF